MRPPLNLGETLDAAFKIVGARWRTLALVMAAVAIPIELLSFGASVLATDDTELGKGLFLNGHEDGVWISEGVIVVPLTIVGYLLGTLACYRAVTDTYAGRDTSAAASLRTARERLAPALWLMILVIVPLLIGLVACLLPGIWLGVAWSVAIPVLLVEGLTGISALARSYELVHGRWWPTFGRLFTAYVIALVISGVVAAILTAPVEAVAGSGSVAALAAQHLAGALTSLVTTPFVVAVTALVYFDLRARKEGFDPSAGGLSAGESTATGELSPGGGSWLPPVPPS